MLAASTLLHDTCLIKYDNIETEMASPV